MITKAEYLGTVREMIEDHGRMIQIAFPSDAGKVSEDEFANACFCYTIGNHLKGFPELLIIGPFQPVTLVTPLLNSLSDEMIGRGRSFEHGELVQRGMPIAIVDTCMRVRMELTTVATAFFSSPDYGVMQVVLCDPQGRLPWDDGCAAPYSLIKIWRRLDA